MLAHKAVPHECRHLLWTTMCFAIPTSPDSGLTSRCGWTAQATPPPSYTWPIQHTRSDLTCFITGQAAGHIYICWLLLPGQTRFGPRRTAIQRRLRRFHNRRIVRALAFYQGWWGVRPKSRVTSQPPRLVDLLYREDPHILCFREACQQPSFPSLFGMPHGHSLSCLLIRRYRMSAVTFCLSLIHI